MNCGTTIIIDMLKIKITLISDINKQNCLGIANSLFILAVSVHNAIATITPANIKITTSLKLQSKKIAVIKAVKFSQLENFKVLIFLNSPFHYRRRNA